MKVFGGSDRFSYGYKFLDNPFNEQGILGESWGLFELRINGKDVCKYIQNHRQQTYTWNLIYLVEWLIENLDGAINDSSYPIPVSGNDIFELKRHSEIYLDEDEEDWEKWFELKQDWEFRHSWISARAGSFLADVTFRRNNSDVEISWDNEDLYEEVAYVHLKGAYELPLQEFIDITNRFVKEFLSDLETKCRNEKEREYLQNLRAR
ncbi:DUF5984 family protein [Paenibacillus sp. HB172176]|uniref:DUF5984 family protein n=1 Tax=Paenibacillus sp. HB172176 TaxID=2493690 RepID=UPI00143B5F26|nr:DUF5984 family protein [Paenibacillus sp. HB172176]